MKKYELYKCNVCGNIAYKLIDQNTNLSCCNQEMTLLKENTVDASVEKHVPVMEITNNEVKIKIGSEPHPMIEEHHISFIALITSNGIKINHLEVNKEAVTTFGLLKDEKVLYTLEYCNLHGLWKKEN